MRSILAGIAGGIAMFVWASIAHVALPLGATGVSALPNEASTIAAISQAMDEHGGLFLFPDMRGKQAPKGATGASGFFVYRPHAAIAMQPSTLGWEFATELVEALIAAALISWASISGFAARVGFASLVGLAAAVTTNVSYWNWYGFPLDYTLAYGFIQVVGYAVAGAVIALVLPRRAGV